MTYVAIQNLVLGSCIVVFCWINPMLFSAVQVKTSPCGLILVMLIVETFPLDRSSSSPLRSQLMVIGGSPKITLQIITIVNPLTVYTVDPTLTVMTPFSTEGGSDPPVSITTASKYNVRKNNNSYIDNFISMDVHASLYMLSQGWIPREGH